MNRKALFWILGSIAAFVILFLVLGYVVNQFWAGQYEHSLKDAMDQPSTPSASKK